MLLRRPVLLQPVRRGRELVPEHAEHPPDERHLRVRPAVADSVELALAIGDAVDLRLALSVAVHFGLAIGLSLAIRFTGLTQPHAESRLADSLCVELAIHVPDAFQHAFTIIVTLGLHHSDAQPKQYLQPNGINNINSFAYPLTITLTHANEVLPLARHSVLMIEFVSYWIASEEELIECRSLHYLHVDLTQDPRFCRPKR